MDRVGWLACSLLLTVLTAALGQGIPAGTKKIVFLGDSITHAGQYVAIFETELLLSGRRDIEVLNLGLPSETLSGLSEEGHAGGKFPRPDLHERLDRVLDKTRPDLIFASYGMNDAIYLPFSEERLERYRDGQRRLREKAKAAGARVIHLTPAVFDPVPIRARLAPADTVDANHPYEKYDDVLDRYAEWLLEQRKHGWEVIDLHFPMKKALADGRRLEPTFTYARDGVHPNVDGQVVMGHALLRGLDLAMRPEFGSVKDPMAKRAQVYKLVESRQRVLRDAWLSHTGHKRPLAAGLPIDEARKKVAEITKEMVRMLE